MWQQASHVSFPWMFLTCFFVTSLSLMGCLLSPCVMYGQTIQREQGLTEFSARIVWSRGGERTDALLFAKPDRYRLEHRGGVKTEYGYAGVTIIREDQQELWYLFSEKRVFVAVPLLPSHLLPLSTTLEGEIGRTRIGEGTVNGQAAILFEVVVERYGRREAFFLWIDERSGFLVKLLNKHQDWSIEYQHVVFSKQPGYYFDVPRGYQRVDAQEQPRPLEEH